jgi:hypothetical protein
MPGRAELARLAAVRGVEHTDVIRLGSVAISVLAERSAYRDAVLALFRTEHPSLSGAGVGADLRVRGDAATASSAAPPMVSMSRIGERRPRVTTGPDRTPFAGDPIELFLALQGRPGTTMRFASTSVAVHRALFLLERVYCTRRASSSGRPVGFVGDKAPANRR